MFGMLFGRKKRAGQPSEAAGRISSPAFREIEFSVGWPSAIAGRIGSVNDAQLLISDAYPISARDIEGLRQGVLKEGSRPTVLVAPSFSPAALPLLDRGNGFAVTACELPGEHTEDVLADLAGFTRGRLLATALGFGLGRPVEPGKSPAGLILPGLEWSDVQPEDLGRATSVTIGRQGLVVRAPEPREFPGMLAGLLQQFQNALNDAEREGVARRFARLGRSPAKIPPSDPVRPIAPNAILIPGGHATPFFMTDPGNGLTDLCGVRVLVADMDLADMSPVIHPTELAMREGVPLVVLARSLNGAALALLTVNKLRGIVSVAGAGVALPAVEASALLRKVAGVTGAHLMVNPADVASCSASALGRASRVLMARSWTIVAP